MKNRKQALEWLKRAESNLSQARLGQESSEILLEDLCFCAQQASEKALKALCISRNIPYPRTHDIGYLLDLLEEKGISVPPNISNARELTQYAVETRYPGAYEPVTKSEYLATLKMAQSLVSWVKEKIEEKP